jgi:predicted nuclease of predicted toxin-antitoxin system
VKVLLDENFPLGLLRALHADGIPAEHVITLRWRGVSDQELRELVQWQDVLFVTQDTEFLMTDVEPFSVVVVSRVRQARLLADRVAVWHRAVRDLIEKPRAERLFELTDDGQLLPWTEVSK